MDWSGKRHATIWIIGDGAAQVETARIAARAAGLRIGDPLSIEAALVASRPDDSVALIDGEAIPRHSVVKGHPHNLALRRHCRCPMASNPEVFRPQA